VDLVSAALLGIVLGVSLAAPPGPITAMIVDRASRSALGGVSVGFGAMSADFILLIMVFSFGYTVSLEKYDQLIYLAGAAVFFIMAYMVARSRNDATNVSPRSSGYASGLLVGIMNPFQIIWWFTAGLGFYEKFGYYPFLFLFAGTTLWVFVLGYAIRYSVIKFGDRVREITKGFSTLALIAFGIYFVSLVV
jgi:threonine/homoserine/homoserine lactone efflux protein